jgi:ribonuclease P protein component
VIGRLKRRAEFLQVAAANRKWVAPGLILQVCRHSRLETVTATPKGGADILRPDRAAPTIAGPVEQPADRHVAQPQAASVTAADAPAGDAPVLDAVRPVAAPMRVGFTASRKVGNAVKRNRAKRRLRAAVDIVVRENGAPGHDVVLIARQSTIKRDFAALVQDLTTGLKKLGAYRPDQRP